jgi:hypothetical protein
MTIRGTAPHHVAAREAVAQKALAGGHEGHEVGAAPSETVEAQT